MQSQTISARYCSNTVPEKLNAFVESVIDENDGESLLSAYENVERFGKAIDEGIPDTTYIIDIYHFISLVHDFSTNQNVKSKSVELMDALSASKIDDYHSDDYYNAYGSSILFYTDEKEVVNQNFKNPTIFYQNTKWDELIEYIKNFRVIRVLTLPSLTNPPTDPDSDGLYEDLNANSRKDFNDVVLMFNQMQWIAANEPVSAFDFNRNGRIDFNDIVKLFGEI